MKRKTKMMINSNTRQESRTKKTKKKTEIPHPLAARASKKKGQRQGKETRRVGLRDEDKKRDRRLKEEPKGRY